jgi:hypothetical protein
MSAKQPYIMRDQVKNLVPSIMGNTLNSSTRKPVSINHLTFFALFTASYILSIALSV